MFLSVLISQIVPILAQTIQRGESNVRCTMEDYQSPLAADPTLWDNAAGWCGIRYSVLNVARIVAVNTMSNSMCNQCIQIVGQGGTTQYVLAVDQKGAPGLDIAPDSYQALFPGGNNLDPHVCSWSVVDPSMCGQICFGSAEECTVGVRNLLPASLLPSYPVAFVGLGEPKFQAIVVSSNNNALPTTYDPTIQSVPTTTTNLPCGSSVSTAEAFTTTAAAVYGSSNRTTGSSTGILSSTVKSGPSFLRLSALMIMLIAMSF